MKKLTKTILVMSFTLSALIAKPNILIENALTLDAEKTIKESIKFPPICYSRDQKVQVLFTTNENGNVNFVLAKTNDKILKQEIEKQFYSLRLVNLKQDAVNSVTLNFKTI